MASPAAASGATAEDTPPLLRIVRTWPVYVRELIAGGAAGATAKSVVAPLERCKILFQTGKLHQAGVFPTMRAIFRGEGVRGLFRGNGASVLRIVPYASVHFGLYEQYRRVLVTAVYGPRDDHHGVSPFVDLCAGSSAGATAVLVTYPLDLVRTRLAYMTEAGTLKAPPSAETRLPGAPSSSSGAASLPRRLHQQQQPGHGGGKRLLHGWRTADPHHSIRGVLATTLRQDGVRGLYHGMGASMYGILPYAGLKFFVYQHLKQSYLAYHGAEAVVGVGVGSKGDSPPAQGRLPVPAMLAFGGVAGIIGQTATYPLDVVRRRMQVEGLKRREPRVALGAPHFPDQPLPRSTPAALVAIARGQGWRVLFSGLSINYMKVVPSTAIGFTLYDSLKLALELPTHL